jgi:osmoprotectant transport system ATP-binding protein
LTDNKGGSTRLAYLSFRDVSYRVDGRVILQNLSFDVDRGETLVLLGRSGSGKTTALRLINRTLEPTSGAITLDGRNICELDPIELRRRTGYVIQEFGLLPHWTVEENVALVPRLLGWTEDKRLARARELLDQVGLGHSQIASRKPHQLSGGQRQRVAVARALAAEPGLLLFDEPFGALDPVTRHEMQLQFLELQKRYQLAAIFVTHDILEALAIGTRVAVLDSGKLEQIATPERLFEAPAPMTKAFLDTLPAAIGRGLNL